MNRSYARAAPPRLRKMPHRPPRRGGRAQRGKARRRKTALRRSSQFLCLIRVGWVLHPRLGIRCNKAAAHLHILKHALGREGAPLQKLFPQLGQESAVETVPARIVAAQTRQDHVDFIDLRERAGLDLEFQMLTDAEVEGSEPDGGGEAARGLRGGIGVRSRLTIYDQRSTIYVLSRHHLHITRRKLPHRPLAMVFEKLAEIREDAIRGGLVDGEG